MERFRNFDFRKHMPSLAFTLLAVAVIAGAGAITVYLGLYNIAADAPHSRLTYSVIETFREQSIAARSGSIAVPADLAAPARIASGAGLYTEMCSGCHLAPGMEKTEMSQGLYPQAPILFKGSDRSASEQFWIIKHGIKMTAMPAWGKTHDDRLIWDMVAFIRQLPSLSPAQYQAMTQNVPMDHDAMMKGMTEAKAASQETSEAGEHAGH
ncbi:MULTISPECIES: c-type cytochrome [Sphingopyxis]|jgi:mono/diheme cytochrome c family protein|uniref:Cytochrome c family protein n=1 Tax=Sphingopyxis granuli TaxID=267128 RepID=A0AA86L045_9SPHN|nr:MULTISPECIES: cytochrome c [Sphingopyxis]ALC14216.1 cytochrome C [Sphingopyxis sp. 113P3]AMG72519.1 Cytochrome c family protein [Sphingopyxis granuli]MCA0208483.1 cytochrome c [Pseudomonadota bacterium]